MIWHFAPYAPSATLWSINHGLRRSEERGFRLDLRRGRWLGRGEDPPDSSDVRSNVRLFVSNTANALDMFIVHVAVGMSVEDALRYLQPRLTFVSHVLELGHSPHPPRPYRWSFDYAFGTIASFAEREATVLTWGERWSQPGTVISSMEPE